METVPKTMTYAEFAELPGDTRAQLIDGELVMSPAPLFRHQNAILELGMALAQFVKKRNLGTVVIAPFDVYLSDTEAYQPDVLFVSAENGGRLQPGRVAGAPDLVVEVLSPSTARYDLTHKKRIYELHGVREYWIVDPDEQSVEIYANRGRLFDLHARLVETGEAASRLLDGFSISLATLFA